MKKGILQQLTNLPNTKYKPIPFWSINSKLEKEEIIRQIGEMQEFGLGGFVFHARTGLQTEYLSEEWFEMAETALEEAKKRGMQVWIYDENGWPSGFVSGRLLQKQENLAAFLRYAVLDEYDENAYAVYEYTEEDGARLLEKGEKIEGKYHTVYKIYSDAYTDILNPAVVDQFIEETYDKYYERFADRFGKELVGFFTDEPQYYRWETPISAMTEGEYFKQYGKDVKEGLLYLFVQNEKGYPFRMQYYNLMNRLYCDNFYQKLTDWCEEKGCLLTGHSVEETQLSTQMWGGADCATSYIHEHIPAIDNLQKCLTAEISAKNVGSVAAQFGMKDVFTETFGVSGYSTTPKQLKAIADKQYVYGVDMMIQHLYNYSLAGQGKIDCPPSFGRTMPWISGYPQFNEYYERLGYLIANSKEEAPVAVIVPMESVYMEYLRLDERETVKKVDEPFFAILTLLRSLGIAYHFVNEKILEQYGSVQKGHLVVGKCVYSGVVVANCREIKSNTLALLHQYMSVNGKLCVIGESPSYVDGYPQQTGIVNTCALEELPTPIKFQTDGIVSYTYRTFNKRKFLFVVNENNRPVEIKTEIPFSRVDLVECKGYAAEKTHIIPAVGAVLLEEKGKYKEKYPTYTKETTVVPQFVGSDKNNLTIERITAIKENGEKLTGYLYAVFEMLNKTSYKGDIRIQFIFNSDCEREIVLTREKQKIKNATLNGVALGEFTQAEEDVNFEYATLLAKEGENVYEYEVDFTSLRAAAEILYKKGIPESLLNCTTYHTGMEQIYIAGDFDVDGYTLKTKAPKRPGDLSSQGYGNFYGATRYEFNVENALENCYVKPIGDYSQCIVIVGDKKYRSMMEEGVFVEKLEGKVTIECYSTLRNRFGPFHWGNPYDDGVAPDAFTIRNRWEDLRTNRFFCENKQVVPFGLSEVRIKHN